MRDYPTFIKGSNAEDLDSKRRCIDCLLDVFVSITKKDKDLIVDYFDMFEVALRCITNSLADSIEDMAIDNNEILDINK